MGDWMKEEEILGLLASGGPVPLIILYEIEKGAGDNGIIGDELLVEVGEAKEGLYFLHFGGGWPCSDAIKFNWVHGKLAGFHNHPKVFDFRNIKLALFEL